MKREGTFVNLGAVVRRQPGQSLREEFDNVMSDKVLFPFIIVAGGMVFLLVELLHVYGNLKPSVLIGILAFVLSVVYAFLKIRPMLVYLRKIKQGERGERIVAQEIEKTPIENGNRKFNIDHLLVGPNGVFAVETKNYTKPNKGGCEVFYDGKEILWAGRKHDKDELTQAQAVAKSAHELILRETGLSVFVKPVLCAVGWYARSKNLYGNAVLLVMEKTLSSVILKSEPPYGAELSDKDRSLVVQKISQIRI
jgi:hypothetical protein